SARTKMPRHASVPSSTWRTRWRTPMNSFTGIDLKDPHMSNIDNSRRDFLRRSGYGIGALTVGGVIGNGGVFASLQAAELEAANPLAPKQPHFPAKAKSVIWLHMIGAPA